MRSYLHQDVTNAVSDRIQVLSGRVCEKSLKRLHLASLSTIGTAEA